MSSINQEYYRKNWNSIFKLSKLGISGYWIYIANDNLYFQLVDIQQRNYDITGKLIQCTIFYENYQKNAQTVRLFEIYTLNNEQVTINRAIYSISDNQKQFVLDYKTFNNNPNLEQEQVLNINYIPIAIMRNRANEEPDCNKVMDKIKDFKTRDGYPIIIKLQKPSDVINNLFKQWKLDYPNYISLPQVQILKQIVIMLSSNIYSNMSINKGLNDDNKILLPYYFELKSSPIHHDKNDSWKYLNVWVKLKSQYFDFTDINNIKLKKAFLPLCIIFNFIT
ncbi:hypothetical protein [Spiroplasma endosymbiont of Virgichneumon dumeticola]|uniref:hypothetical protein n=1 Tax=Spiroplasma endosymbiont of Virgichneumon dumeticola TaxID=3139323 RepID=UPI0035C9017F